MDNFKATKFGQPFVRSLYLMVNNSVMFRAVPCDFETGPGSDLSGRSNSSGYFKKPLGFWETPAEFGHTT